MKQSNPQLTPAGLISPSNHRRAIKWLLAVIAALFALLLGLLTLLQISGSLFAADKENAPVALLAGLILATLPVPVYVLLIVWLDRYEREPVWMLATTFIWGATIATFVSIIINTISGGVVASISDGNTGAVFSTIVSAPVVEESAKAFVLFAIFFWKKDEFDDITDGIIYAGMVALGFAAMENVSYYAQAFLGVFDGGRGGFEGTLPVFIVRGVMSPFMHPLFTAMTGIGLGWARQTDNRIFKFVFPPLGFMSAILLHFIWNLSNLLGTGFYIIYFLFMVPVFVAVLVTVFFALRREGRVLREYLLCDFQNKFLTEEEYNHLCSIRGRMRASLRALTRGGFGTWRTQMRLNQTASELAFHRSRVARGIIRKDETAAEREAAYLQHLRALRESFNSSKVRR